VPLRIACVVEGHGDVEAVPIIIRRIAAEIQPSPPIEIARPIRTPKSKLVKQGELERAVELAVRQVRGRGAVIVLVDDCPKQVGPELLARAQSVRNDVPVSVVLAVREVESWFIAAAESIAGQHGLPDNMQVPPDIENIRGAKEWITQHMQGAKAYSPTLDEPSLAKSFDLRLASRAESFSKFRRDVTRILQTLSNNAAG